MRFKTLLIAILFLSAALFGQKCIVSGFVTDASTGEAIAGANAYIEGEPFGAAANLYGYYTIAGLPNGGPWTLVVSAIGYSTAKRQIVCKGSPLRLDFELEPEIIKGKEIVIQAKRVGGMMDPYVGHSIVESELIRHAPGLAEPDLFRTLQMLPGVQSISDFSSGLYIWGGTPGDNLVLLDNIEVYNPTHLMGFFSTFIVDAVREANLIKGGYPAKWGGRLGSLLEVTNKDGNRKSFDGIAELSLLSGKAMVEGPVGKGSYLVAGRRTWIDMATKLLERNNLMDENLPYYFYDFQGRINQDLTDRDKLTFSFYAGDDIFAFEEDNGETSPDDTIYADDDQDDSFEYRWGNITLSTQWTHVFNERLFGHLVLAGSRFRTKLDSGGDDMKIEDRIGDITLKGDMTYSLNDANALDFGGMLKWREINNYFKITDYDYETDEEQVFTSDDYTGASLIAAYCEDEYQPNLLWKVQGGLRLEFATNGDYFRVGPRLSVQRRLDDLTTLRAAYGHYYQYIHLVNPLEEVGIAVFDSWIPCGDDLKPAMADHFVLGMDTDRLPMHLSANAYYKIMSNLIEPREEIIFGGVDDIRARFNIGTGWAAGFDLSMEGKVGRFAGWAGYGLGWVKRKMADVNNGEPYPPKYDRRHTLKLSLAYEPLERLTLSVAFNYGTGQPVTTPIGFEEEDYGSYRYFWPIWEDGAYHNGRLPDYHRLDFALNWVAHEGNWRFIPYLQILNVYNRENVLMRSWNEPMFGNTEPDDDHMLPFLPTFGVRAEF